MKELIINRLVVNAQTDSIEQVTHYYPYGGVIGDISTNESFQAYMFEGKELDRTFGLDNYDIGARQYFAMAPMWDWMDKLAEKYYWISPYVYCGGDPVNKGDYDGREFNFGQLNENQLEKYYEAVKMARANSSSFDKLYSIMEASDQVISIVFGETITSTNGSVDAQYQPGQGNTGTITINQNTENINSNILGEEIFHAFQQDNKAEYKGLCNKEFEAKTFTTIVGEEFLGSPNIPGMNDFQNRIILRDYSSNGAIVTINEDFLNDYMNYANKYSEYNIKNNIGNQFYREPTRVNPYSLIKILVNQ